VRWLTSGSSFWSPVAPLEAADGRAQMQGPSLGGHPHSLLGQTLYTTPNIAMIQ